MICSITHEGHHAYAITIAVYAERRGLCLVEAVGVALTLGLEAVDPAGLRLEASEAIDLVRGWPDEVLLVGVDDRGETLIGRAYATAAILDELRWPSAALLPPRGAALITHSDPHVAHSLRDYSATGTAVVAVSVAGVEIRVREIGTAGAPGLGVMLVETARLAAAVTLGLEERVSIRVTRCHARIMVGGGRALPRVPPTALPWRVDVHSH